MIEALKDAAGADAVRSADTEETIHGVAPRVVVAPDSTDACAATLATCSAHGWSVEVAGARTSRGWGRPVAQVDVLLRTTRLSGIVEYEPDDLTIGVAAGTTMTELRARVELNRQRVPLDSPTDHASVGGVLARAAAGPLRRGWSSPRRQTLGLEVVTGDGRVLRVGGRVVKNVAGYDLNKLFVGSAGTLGVITRAHLRLLPQPLASATISLAANDYRPLADAARVLLAGAMQPAALELVGEPWRLLARYEGSPEALASALELLRRTALSLGCEAARADDALARLAALEADAELVVRVADLPDRIAHTIARAAEIGAGGTIAAHAGEGIVRVLVPGEAPIDVPSLARAIDDARRGFDGTLIVERGPAQLMRALDPWPRPADMLMEITHALKRQFDPAGILQPGRWLA